MASTPSGKHLARQLRPRILALYRSVLRAGRSWEGDPEERRYILEEAAGAFRDHSSITSREQLERKLEEAERRLHLVVHYGIAYPRLHHLSTGALFPGKAASDQAAEAAEVAAAASASAVVQGPAVFGSLQASAYETNPFSDDLDFEPPSVRSG